MLRPVVLLALVAAAAAQGKCIDTTAVSITAGICSGKSLGGSKMCTGSDMTVETVNMGLAFMALAMGMNTEEECKKSATDKDMSDACPPGATAKADTSCEKGSWVCDVMAAQSSTPQCSSDSDCLATGEPKNPPMMCCKSMGQQLDLMCDGVSSSDKDMMMKAGKDEEICSDASGCIDLFGAGTSLRASSFLPAVAAVVALAASLLQ
mmetsp:Transcript_20022/g.50057  ORF Transcript_20022/g.50057 Transcript_20022/m.50057 type:complete len:207 (-) Transcript_20022:504-1124(-)